MKKKSYKQENIFANYTSNKGLVSKIYNELLNSTVKYPPKHLIRKRAKDTNRFFFFSFPKRAHRW